MNAWTRALAVWTFATGLAGTGSLAEAGPYDGSRPFLCAVTATTECDASGRCEQHLPDGENSPAFFRVDVAAQTVTGGPSKRSTVRSVNRLDGELILQGGEHGRGWTATIDEETGRMAAAVVDNDHTFSLFGACTIP